MQGFEDTYEETQQEPFLIDMFYLCNKSNKKTSHEKKMCWLARVLENAMYMLLF